MNDQNHTRGTRRPRYETMQNPAQNTGSQPPRQRTQTMRTQPPGPDVSQRGYTQTQPNAPFPTVKNPPQYGMTRPSMPHTGTTQPYSPAQAQPTQPMPRQQTGAYYANQNTQYGQYTQYGAPIPNPIAMPPRQAARAAKNRSNTWLIAAIAGILGLGAMLAIAVLALLISFAPERIADGVSVSGFDVGGRTFESAASVIAQIPEPQIALVDGDRSFQVRLSDLGGSIDTAAALEAVKAAAPNSSVELPILMDLARAQFGLVALSDTINIDAVPGNPPQIGRSMEIPVMLDRLRADPSGELADGMFELNMIEVEPPVLLSGVNANPEARTTHIVEQGQELALIARQYGVTLDDILQFNNISDPDFIYAGQELTIPAAGMYVPANVPPAPVATGKAIVVSTGDQRIYAYENGQMIRSHLISTGLPATPTVTGDYRIYVKYQATDMSGPGYYLPDVPYTMYFYQGYGIHGTYWHNSFGRPMSHGCVNLPTEEAQWFFNWAPEGTLVRVI